jgi:putative flippase GtrA
MELIFANKILTHQKLIQLSRFIITGFLGLLIDFLITWICKEHLGLNKYISNAFGFVFAVVNNYSVNKIWTFNDTEKAIGKQFFTFLLISIVGLALNTFLLYIIIVKFNLQFYISKAMVIAIVFVWNYLANSLITFKKV